MKSNAFFSLKSFSCVDLAFSSGIKGRSDNHRLLHAWNDRL